MIDKAYVIKLLRPNSSFALINNKIEWHDSEQTQPTETEINNKTLELQADYDTKQYQRDRVYPSIQEQLDMQYWDNVNGTTTWNDTITKIKTDNPKN
jgi:hypothetical protein